MDTDTVDIQLDQIRNFLTGNPEINVVGELSVLNQSGPRFGSWFSERVDFYIEPKNPPFIPVLSDRQVEALNAAAYYKSQPDKELAKIPAQLAQDYNKILRSLFDRDLVNHKAQIIYFAFTAALACASVGFGEWGFGIRNPRGKLVTTQTLTVFDPELEKRARMYFPNLSMTNTQEVLTTVHVRLFPPDLGQRVYLYEKGFYLDGNVEEWRELVYKNRYISKDRLSPEQIQDLAKGLRPFPQVVYKATSDFDTDQENLVRILSDRSARRDSIGSGILGPLPHLVGYDDSEPEYSGGSFSERDSRVNKERTGDPQELHNH